MNTKLLYHNKHSLLLLFVLLSTIFSANTYSQTKQLYVVGKVEAKNGDAINAAQITLKGTSYRTNASAEGTFRLPVNAGE